MKICTKCGIEKPLDDYYRRSGRPQGVQSACKECCCASVRSRKARLMRSGEWDATAKRDAQLRYNFGIGIERYDDMLAAQSGVCAICGSTCSSGRNLAVDHCHETGRIRGLLCGNCNKALGLLGDDPDRLVRAVEYLKELGPIEAPL